MRTFRRALQEIAILLARPYIRRELMGWGLVYRAFVGDYHRDSMWIGSPEKIIRDKTHGYLLHLDISTWSDRIAYFLGRWYALDMLLFIKDVISSGDTVVDIGANRGMFTMCVSRCVGPQGKVISFEPNPASRGLLERELKTNNIQNVIVHPFGASNVAGLLKLTVPFVNSGEATFGQKEGIGEKFYQVEAALVTADSMLKFETPTLIKIDVEGYESFVIEGLFNTIEQHHPIIITEIIDEHLRMCGSSATALKNKLHEFGYIGHSLSLQKAKAGYAWKLDSMDDNQAVDIVWVHPLSKAASRIKSLETSD